MRAGFITFEGIDGSGKTTIARSVCELLRARGEHVFLTAEPTKGWIGDAVRRSYDDDVGPIAESFLFLADRAMHQVELRRRLADGEIVVCDRYADSTYAYQGARLEGIVADPIAFLRRASDPWLLRPDATILLRVAPDVGLRRIQGRPGKIRFEDPSLLAKVAANYDVLARDKGFVVLDATRPVEALVRDAVAVIEKTLTPRTKGR